MMRIRAPPLSSWSGRIELGRRHVPGSAASGFVAADVRVPAVFRLRQFNQHCLPIDLHHSAWVATELFASKYLLKGLAWSEDVIVPMCQSPKIADVLLRARQVPANDNYTPAQESMKSIEPENAFKAAWQTSVIFFCVIVPVLLSQLIRFIMSEASARQRKNQEFPAFGLRKSQRVYP